MQTCTLARMHTRASPFLAGLKIKDVAKRLGKKFATGATVTNDDSTGEKAIDIQVSGGCSPPPPSHPRTNLPTNLGSLLQPRSLTLPLLGAHLAGTL